MKIGDKYEGFENLTPATKVEKGDLVVRLSNAVVGPPKGTVWRLKDEGGFSVKNWHKLPHQLGDIYENYADLEPLTEKPEDGTILVRRQDGVHTPAAIGEVWIYSSEGRYLDFDNKTTGNACKDWSFCPEFWAKYPMPQKTSHVDKLGRTWSIGDVVSYSHADRIIESFSQDRVKFTGGLGDSLWGLDALDRRKTIEDSPLPYSGNFNAFKGEGDFHVIHGERYHYIIRLGQETIPQVDTDDGIYKENSDWDDLSGLKITKATPEQSAHLQACIDADKYVEPSEIPKSEWEFEGEWGDFKKEGIYRILVDCHGRRYDYSVEVGGRTLKRLIHNSLPIYSENGSLYKRWKVKVRAATEQAISHLNACTEAGEYVEPTLTTQSGIDKVVESAKLDPKNLVVGEIYTCSGSCGNSWIYQFTKETARIPACDLVGPSCWHSPESDFQSDSYFDHAIATDEQKQKLCGHFPNLKFAILAESTNQDVEYWQDLYGQCRVDSDMWEKSAQKWYGDYRAENKKAFDLECERDIAEQELEEAEQRIKEAQEEARLDKEDLAETKQQLQESEELAEKRRTVIIEKWDKVDELKANLEAENKKSKAWAMLATSLKEQIQEKDQQIDELSKGFFKKFFKRVL